MPLRFDSFLQGGGGSGGITDPYWDNVVLLAPFDGSDGEAASSDLSNSGHTLVFAGDAELDSAQARYGATSLLCKKTANGDAVSIADSADWNLAGGDFTIDIHARYNGDPGTTFLDLISQYGPDASNRRNFVLETSNNNLNFFYSTDGDNLFVVSGAWNPAGDTWYDVAVDRVGNMVRTYVGGAVIASADIGAVSLHDSAETFWIGNQVTFSNRTFDGWLANVRITKGVGRYGGAYTPLGGLFPTS